MLFENIISLILLKISPFGKIHRYISRVHKLVAKKKNCVRNPAVDKTRGYSSRRRRRRRRLRHRTINCGISIRAVYLAFTGRYVNAADVAGG